MNNNIIPQTSTLQKSNPSTLRTFIIGVAAASTSIVAPSAQAEVVQFDGISSIGNVDFQNGGTYAANFFLGGQTILGELTLASHVGSDPRTWVGSALGSARVFSGDVWYHIDMNSIIDVLGEDGTGFGLTFQTPLGIGSADTALTSTYTQGYANFDPLKMTSTVPEPGTLALLGAGLLGLGATTRRRVGKIVPGTGGSQTYDTDSNTLTIAQ